MKGKIVLIPFPFIVAFISSKIPDKISKTDVLVTLEYPSFKRTGLKTSSIIKLDKIATILKELIVGELGEIDENLRKEINEKLAKIFGI